MLVSCARERTVQSRRGTGFCSAGALALLLLGAAAGHLASAQNVAGPSPSTQQGAVVQPGSVLRVTTREVVVDLLARDRHDQPVTDLHAAELQVSELDAQHGNVAQQITSLRFIPALADPGNSAAPGCLHVQLGSGCAEHTTAHYELTYRVRSEQLRDGEHRLLVTSTRPHIVLRFGTHYFVAGTARIAGTEGVAAAEARLLQAACLHSRDPLSVPLLAHQIVLADAASLHYQLLVPPPALSLISVAVQPGTVDLEVAACSFDQNGRPLRFMHAAESRSLRSGEYVQATLKGLTSLVALPAADHPATIRFVVRDRVTGNMGAVLVDAPAHLAAGELTPDEKHAAEQWAEHVRSSAPDPHNSFPPLGPLGSFGTIEPRAGTLCGDVYTLPEGTPKLPNFWSLDAIGSLHTYLLDVPHQQFWKTGGIPGVTRATEWFGIDYYGAFEVSTPGRYQFTLLADDGAKLYIDDRLVINDDGVHNLQAGAGAAELAAGAHTLHVPYYQGPGTSVALQLFVRPPGGRVELFDLREFGELAKLQAKPTVVRAP